jgi:hypothetical protein
MEEAWKTWSIKTTNQNIKALPLLIIWGAWLARNASIFQDRNSILDIIVAQGLSILSHFPQDKGTAPVRFVQQEHVDFSETLGLL